MTTVEECIIWGIPTKVSKVNNGWKIHSPRTDGDYIWEGDWDPGDLLPDALRAKITSWLVDQRRFGIAIPLLSRRVIDDCRSRRRLSVRDRMDRLLRAIERKTNTLGARIVVTGFLTDDWPAESDLLAWSESVDIGEVKYLLKYLIDQGLLDCESVGAASQYFLTPKGFARLGELDANAPSSEQAFVAMWFDDSMKELYNEGIAPAVTLSGYRPVRIDGKDHNNKIDDEIIAEIRRSRFVVADFTHGKSGHRGGVYFEAGFAKGLNLAVIFTCREDLINEVHFDTRQYNHIVWTADNLDDFKKRLSQRISATLGDGPLKAVS